MKLSRELGEPKNGLFERTAKGELELKATEENGARTVEDFRALGRFLAKAIFDQQCLDMPLAAPVIAALRGDERRSDDAPASPDHAPSAGAVADAIKEVEAVDPIFARSLRYILETDLGDDGGGLEQTFSVQRGSTEVDLCDNGRGILVVEGNKHAYVLLVARWRSRDATAMELDAFLEGCAEVGVVPELLRAFEPDEVDVLINGRRGVDPDELRAHVRHQGPPEFDQNHVVALWFWQMLQDLKDEDRAKVLAFATGSDKVPLDGFEPPLTLTLDPARTDALPVAHTCFNQIVLSLFSCYGAMVQQWRTAVDNCTTFELS